jgi:hypothetical protein
MTAREREEIYDEGFADGVKYATGRPTKRQKLNKSFDDYGETKQRDFLKLMTDKMETYWEAYAPGQDMHNFYHVLNLLRVPKSSDRPQSLFNCSTYNYFKTVLTTWIWME